MSVMIIDGMNFMHRCRAGFDRGEYSVTYNFFRSLRAIVGQFSPSRVIYVLEGHPKRRYEVLSEYKANRVVEEGTQQHADLAKFFSQAKISIDLLSECFPVSVVKHPDHECDDTIWNLIDRGARSTEYVVVSNDSDFTQLLDDFENVNVYNAMKKEVVKKPEYHYVTWKALRGDPTDNIKGIPGIGDKRAAEYALDAEKLSDLLSIEENAKKFAENFELIKFTKWSDNELDLFESKSGARDWERVKATFQEFGFKSLLKEKTWDKFVSTFDPLF